jgi:hypothetical protein
LGAAYGSAGFTLERHWSFLTPLFSFAEEALAFVLTNVNKFLSTENGNIVLLSQTSISNCLSFDYFRVERGVCKQPQDVGKHLPALELCCDLKKDVIK